TNLGIPVPPGFTISTEVCDIFYQNEKQYPEGLDKELKATLNKLETLMGKKLGDPKDPLLVSVRSGAAVSMPGMMDTILNLGMNDDAVEGLAGITGNPRFAWDAYRRFIQMFSNVALGMDINVFEDILEDMKKKKGVEQDTELDATDLENLVELYKAAFKKDQNKDFPQNPLVQLQAAIDAVFGSWNNPKAIKYRDINGIKNLKGTAVNVQCMVFGNFGDDSGTGVCFSRDPSSGENYFYGEYLMNAQGEDVVAGIRTPAKLSHLAEQDQNIYDQLVAIKEKLENHYRDMQDMEFTIQQGKLFILQTRNGKRTGASAVKVAVDMVKEGLISKEEAMFRVDSGQLDQLFHPMIDPKEKAKLEPLANGLNASPGAASGKIVFSADDAELWVERGEGKVLLVRKETSPDDIGGMNVAQGILTSTGGMTSHAAVVARGMGRPCVAGCKEVVISGKIMKVGNKEFNEGDWITIDGTTGEVYEGEVRTIPPEMSTELTDFLKWADDIRLSDKREGLAQQGFLVRTNADQPEDAKLARSLGAEGIGLCRTEHMFFDDGKLEHFQEMIVADTKEGRQKALTSIVELQKADFKGIFKAMSGLPVTVRLLDPPLHEFVPQTEEDIKKIAKMAGITPDELKSKVESLHEHNPMLGHRGCRLGVTYPEIYDMQVEAIISAAVEVDSEGDTVHPEIMIPLIGTWQELKLLRENAEKVIAKVFKETNKSIDYKIGTMIEIPRAAITADEVAQYADFFSFGTNDLTQMTFGFSRDDAGAFLPSYISQGILEEDPTASLDQSGVGKLVSMAADLARGVKSDLKLGICGEHGGDPDSIDFCYRTNLNYVSCSPFRVPIARHAAAQAVLNNK
ncbi:MAG: pyruvate, phosphate dikinase, partial [Spirochaetales bacterium]|nr:pyruvate, phosphate dikinase [Spirochaetales bacterium]